MTNQANQNLPAVSGVPPADGGLEDRLRAAFEAGFRWCSSGTDKFGEYNGGTWEDGFAEFLKAERQP
jgi:hypothetical protein